MWHGAVASTLGYCSEATKFDCHPSLECKAYFIFMFAGLDIYLNNQFFIVEFE
jgi:hypothetical protein